MPPPDLPITIGADPEVAVISVKEQRYVSAYNMIEGTKLKPEPVGCGQILVDGTMLEYGIEPCSTAQQFEERNKTMLDVLSNRIGSDYKLDISSSVIFDKIYFDHRSEAEKELGCAPDFNAWSGGSMNPSPKLHNLYVHTRVCGGHIHIGWTQNADVTSASHLWDCRTVVKALDCYVYPYLHLIEPNGVRKNLYGKLGAFRPKSYGVEWRVPSNQWLKDANLWKGLFTLIHQVVSAVKNGSINPTALTLKLVDENISKLTGKKLKGADEYFEEKLSSDRYATQYLSLYNLLDRNVGFNKIFTSTIASMINPMSNDLRSTGGRVTNVAVTRVAPTSGFFMMDLDLDVKPANPNSNSLNYTGAIASDQERSIL